VTYILEIVAKSVILAIGICFTVKVYGLLKLIGKDSYDAGKNNKKFCCFTYTEKKRD
jgi:hypothetical protein